MIDLWQEYQRNLDFLEKTGIVFPLPQCGKSGVLGFDGIEYPFPTFTQVYDIYQEQKDVAIIKSDQNFSNLLIVPLAKSVKELVADTVRLLSDFYPNESVSASEISSQPKIDDLDKAVWPWSGLMKAVDDDELIYFPVDCHSLHCGKKKREVICSKSFCPIPGWSVALVQPESHFEMEKLATGAGGRNFLIPGASAKEYFQLLQLPDYSRESGFTIEDALILFMQKIFDKTGPIFDRKSKKATWLLGHYIPYNEHLRTDLIPTVWWHRDYRRLRLDAHRPGNSKCTAEWGCKTLVRLQGTLISLPENQ
jgi:hypothetical protein